MIYNVKNGFPKVYETSHFYWIRYGTKNDMTNPFVCSMYKRNDTIYIIMFGDYVPYPFSEHPTISIALKNNMTILISDEIENPFSD